MRKKFVKLQVDSLPKFLNTSGYVLNNILSSPKSYYKPFEKIINNKKRVICPSVSPLKEIQRELLKKLYRNINFLSCLHGGIPNKSVITNAKCHTSQYLVANFDVKDFFPNTDSSIVKNFFLSIGFIPETAGLLTRLVTFENALPLGAPTSTIIANLVESLHNSL